MGEERVPRVLATAENGLKATVANDYRDQVGKANQDIGGWGRPWARCDARLMETGQSNR